MQVSNAKLSAIYSCGYGIATGGCIRSVSLRFSLERTPWIKDERWHPQAARKIASRRWLPAAPSNTGHRELIMDILEHGAHCEVLGPAGLRKLVAEEVGKMGVKYI